jgi:twinkle protein
VQGVTTLWGSFELKLPRLVKAMITQYAAVDFRTNLDLFDEWADRFEELPMHFLRFFGSTDVEQVLEALRYAVYVYDVQHIVLDNLQFMLSAQLLQGGRGGFGKWDIQDRAIDLFRQFATQYNVHITLV